MKNKPDIAVQRPATYRRTLRGIALGLLLAGGGTAHAATYQFTLTWANKDSAATANQIERSLDGINFTPLATVPPAPASYQDQGLTEGQTYYYRLRSRSPAGDSAYSNIGVATTPPRLVITSPTNYQTVTNNAVIKGTARAANGLLKVKINSQSAVINGTNWSATVALVSGTNTLKVIATDNSADRNTVTQTVHVIVLPAPVPSFTGTPTAGIAPLLVNFTDTSTGPITSRVWSFGDGGSSTSANPAHTYTVAGSYAVTLTVTGPGGTTQLKRTKYVTVTGLPGSPNSPTNAPPASPLQILNGPLVTNALTQLGNVAVIEAGQPVEFRVTAADVLNRPLEYTWGFGDQQTGSGTAPTHTYPATTCQSYLAQVVVCNGTIATSGTVHVATACQLDLTKVEMLTNFVKPNADRFTLSATVALDSTFQPAGQTLAVDLGRAQVIFRLKKTGRSASPAGKCRLVYNADTGLWDLTVSTKKGNWRDLWAAYSMVPGPLPVAAIPVTVPAIVVIGYEAFAAEPRLQYSATTEKLGSAQ